MTEKYMGEALATATVFDDAFQAASYLSDETGQLQAIELAVRHEGADYIMAIETYGAHMARSEAEGADDEDVTAEDDGQTYVIFSEQILPSDLLDIKKRAFEELRPFLLKQDRED